jgi:NDP-sugar pyrophosphorylase family protein
MVPRLTDIAAVVLAGGLGTRVQHLLPDVPKPMAPVAGRPFLEWVARYLARQGVRSVVFSTGYRAGTVEQHFSSHTIPGVKHLCVREEQPLGTAGGFLHAARQSALTPVAWLVLNGDSLVFADLSAVIAHLRDTDVAGVIVGRAVPDASRFGSLATSKQGELERFEEKRPGTGVINTGIYLLRHSLLDEFPAITPLSFERDVFPELVRRGLRIKVHVVDAPFLDIGTPESLPQAEAFVREHGGCFLPD